MQLLGQHALQLWACCLNQLILSHGELFDLIEWNLLEGSMILNLKGSCRNRINENDGVGNLYADCHPYE